MRRPGSVPHAALPCCGSQSALLTAGGPEAMAGRLLIPPRLTLPKDPFCGGSVHTTTKDGDFMLNNRSCLVSSCSCAVLSGLLFCHLQAIMAKLRSVRDNSHVVTGYPKYEWL